MLFQRLSKKSAAVVLLLLLAATASGGMLLYVQATAAPAISEEEARNQVLSRYNGEITQVSLTGDVYRVQLKNENGLYELDVMADETGIASIRKLESTTNGEPASGNDGTDPSAPSSEAPGNETAVPKPSEDPPSSVPSQTPSQQPSTEPTTTPSVLLTKDKAAELALKQVSGKVEDVDLEETGGNPYYLVEIDTPDGREAVVQLHAVSGEAMSVTWDDDEEDKSQDDDTD